MSKVRDAILKIGKESIQPVDLRRPVSFISTGSMLLDAGFGGFPRGRITELYGAPNTGKSTMALIAAIAATERGERVLWIDQERHFDAGWAVRLGLDVDARDDDGNPLLDVVAPATGEQGLTLLLNAVRNGHYHFIVLDSIAKINLSAEIETPLDKDTRVGSMANIMARICRMIGQPLYVSPTEVAVLLLNQERDDIGGYMPGTHSPGGKAMKHEASLRLHTLSPRQTWVDEKHKDQLATLEFRVQMEKSKVGGYNRLIHGVTLVWNPEEDAYAVDTVKEVFVLAKQRGLLRTTKGEPFTGMGGAFFNGLSLGVGEAKILATIGQDYELFNGLLIALSESRDVTDGAVQATPEGDQGEIGEIVAAGIYDAGLDGQAE
jgi:RecA/RadA recombinase